MAKFEIQGVELEFDILDLESAEIYEKALDEVKKRAEKSLGDSKGLSESIREQCHAIFDFIDTLFGKDVHKQIFGAAVNLRECISVYREILSAIEKDGMAVAAEFAPKQNRAQRRAAKKK